MNGEGMTTAQWSAWLKRAEAGHQVVYFEGHLGAATRGDPAVATLQRRVLGAAEAGLVFLFQRRASDGAWAYVARRTAAPVVEWSEPATSPPPKTPAPQGKRVDSAARHRRWAELRLAGKSLADIARKDGVSCASVSSALSRLRQRA
jgi:hypothetical protein